MSELVPFFSDDEELDDNLLRSIETLLVDENEQSSNELNREQAIASVAAAAVADNNGMTGATTPTSPMVPQFQSSNGAFTFGNQVYQKWSTSESSEQQPSHVGMKRIYSNRNHLSRPTNYVKPAKKNSLSVNAINAMRANAEIAQYQAILAEKANQLLTQYLRLNYEHLNAQAQILGIPLEQYIRNLLIALNNQSFLMPPQPFLYAPFNPMTPFMTMPPQSPATPSPPSTPSPTTTIPQQRAWQTKQYFPRKN